MSNFPGGLDVFATKTDGIDKYNAADMNTVQDAIATVQRYVPVVLNVKTDFGAVGNGVADDTTRIQGAITAAQGNFDTVYLPRGTYKLTGALAITQGVSIIGQGAAPLFGSAAVSTENANIPTAAPYLLGAVLVQAATATDIIDITGAGIPVNLRDFGMAFGTPFVNTGHGVYHNPPAYSGARDLGLRGACWQNVMVYGQDGSHYGYWLVNACLDSLDHIYAFGGGTMLLETNVSSPGLAPGNLVVNDLYGIVCVNGSAHGLYLKGTAGNHDFSLFNRPQVQVRNVGAALAVTAPTSAQLMFTGDGTINNVRLIAPDFESNVSSTCNFPAGVSTDFSGAVQGVSVSNPTLMATPFSYPQNGWFMQLVGGGTALAVKKTAASPRQWSLGLSSTDHSLYLAGALGSDGNTPAITAVAGTQAGSGPPAPVVTGGTDLRASVTFGTGTGPSAGDMVDITLTQTMAFVPKVTITEQNLATKNLGLYVSFKSTTHIRVACVNAPAASQGNTIYSFDVHVIV